MKIIPKVPKGAVSATPCGQDLPAEGNLAMRRHDPAVGDLAVRTVGCSPWELFALKNLFPWEHRASTVILCYGLVRPTSS